MHYCDGFRPSDNGGRGKGGGGVLPIMARFRGFRLKGVLFWFRLQVRMGRDFSGRSILKSTENQKG